MALVPHHTLHCGAPVQGTAKCLNIRYYSAGDEHAVTIEARKR